MELFKIELLGTNSNCSIEEMEFIVDQASISLMRDRFITSVDVFMNSNISLSFLVGSFVYSEEEVRIKTLKALTVFGHESQEFLPL